MLSSANAADCVVYCDMEIESSNRALSTSKSLIIEESATLNIVGPSYGIYSASSDGDNIIILKGTVTVNTTGSNSYGLYLFDNNTTITISGNVTLIVESAYGVYCSGDRELIVASTGSLYIKSDNYGIYNQRGTITIEGELTIESSSGGGIYDNGSGSLLTIDGSATIIGGGRGLYLSGGTATINGQVDIKEASYGIYASVSFVVNGDIRIESCTTGVHYYNISGTGTITIDGDLWWSGS